jgi:hypothetical protein
MSDPRTVRSVLNHLVKAEAIPTDVRHYLARAANVAQRLACTGCTEWRDACTCDGRRF